MKHLVECASVPCSLPEDTAREVDALFKSLPSGLAFQRKSLPVEYQFEPGERAEVSVLTSQTVDKSGEVVLPEGLELDSYRRSMIVLWNHDKNKPVASCGWIKHFKDHIRAKTIYPEKPDDVDTPWFTDQVWAMTKSSPPILRCKSIGFLPLAPLREPTAQELEDHPDWAGAGVWEKSLLLEYSCVYNGCNDDALVTAINTKSLDVEKLRIMGVPVPEVKQIDVPEIPKGLSLRDAIAYAKAHAIRLRRKRKGIDMNEVVEKAVESLDVEAIVQKAVQLYQNRHRV